jgi:probable dihydroxyacetone kinase regulator
VVEQKPFSKITVSDLVSDCGINRSTFYYHFKDIYDLVEWIFTDASETLLKNRFNHDTWQDGLLELVQQLLDNRSFIMSIYRHINREHLERYLDRALAVYISTLVSEQAAEMELQQADLDFVTDFYKYALGGILLHWIGDDMKEDPKEIVERIGIIIPSNIAQMLKQFSAGTSQ